MSQCRGLLRIIFTILLSYIRKHAFCDIHLVTKWLQNVVRMSSQKNRFEGYQGTGVT